MSTTGTAVSVKQVFVEKLESFQQQLLQLAESLPESLEELACAEQTIRQGMLKIGQQLLQLWSEAADAKILIPECKKCGRRMRHKGYVRGSLATTLGNRRTSKSRGKLFYRLLQQAVQITPTTYQSMTNTDPSE